MPPIHRLIGKTIAAVDIRGILGCDDTPYLDLWFTDGTCATIEACYGGFTGKSEDEYPRYICVQDVAQPTLADRRLRVVNAAAALQRARSGDGNVDAADAELDAALKACLDKIDCLPARDA